MGAQITRLDYNRKGYPSGATVPFLIGNAGEAFTMNLEFTVSFSFVSSFNNPVFWKDSAFEMLGGTWDSEGFNVGDVINFQFYDADGNIMPTPSGGATTIQFIDGNRLIVAAGTTAALNGNSNLGADVMFPNGQDTGSVNINIAKSPHGVRFLFNLVPNDSNGSIFSILGNQLAPVFLNSGVNNLAVNQSLTMNHFGFRSGGNVTNVILTRLADPLGVFGLERKFRITADFINWGLFEVGNEDGIPSFFELNQCLKPYIELDLYPQFNNPNTAIKLSTNLLAANTGYFNEILNGGINYYSVDSVDFEINGNPVSGIDYSTTTKVTAVINAINQNQFNSFFSYGLFFVPRDTSQLTDTEAPLRQQIMLSNGNQGIYQNMVAPDPTVTGYARIDGSKLETKNVYFQVLPNNKVQFSCEIVPNGAATAYFDSLEEGDREVILYVSIGNSFQTSEPLIDDRVSLILYRGQLEKQPVIAGPYNDVEFTGFYQHPNVDGDILNPVALDTFKEDDVMFRVDFRLEKGANVESLTAQIGGVTPLERFTVSTEGLPVLPDGTIFINYENFRNYRVPQDIQNRRKVTIKRNEALDTLTHAGYTLEYGFLSRWEYWIANANVPISFFNPSLPNNGQSNDWILFEPLTVRLLITIDGLSYFVDGELAINDYDSAVDVTSTHQLFLLDGVTPVGALIAGEELILKATHTKTSAWDVSSTWGWIKAENQESNAYARISSVWDWNTIDKPFRPLTGETKCKLTFPSANVAMLETVVVVDDIINNGMVDFTSRIEGERANPVNAKLLESGEYKVTDGVFPFGNKKKILD